MKMLLLVMDDEGYYTLKVEASSVEEAIEQFTSLQRAGALDGEVIMAVPEVRTIRRRSPYKIEPPAPVDTLALYQKRIEELARERGILKAPIENLVRRIVNTAVDMIAASAEMSPTKLQDAIGEMFMALVVFSQAVNIDLLNAVRIAYQNWKEANR